ncbi:MAG: hypothetical protein NZ529_09070 [Cytophagaceae bacterium]|nr:hypothetical protein [Cytophagaceae bacterium]MDW8456935.1 hypothetical protein [Cytophagaceae bacterium]
MYLKGESPLEIVNANPHLASIFQRLEINPSIWNKSIEEIGCLVNTPSDFIVQILIAFDANNTPNVRCLGKFPIHTILDYLKKTHKYYLNKSIPEMELTLHDILRKYPSEISLVSLSTLFLQYKRKLVKHIKDEEDLLFPYIEHLLELFKNPELNSRLFKNLTDHFSIRTFEESHDEIEEEVVMIKEIIFNLSPKHPIAFSFRIFLNQLQNFENDLHRHSIIEDSVLIPKSLVFEDIALAYKTMQ